MKNKHVNTNKLFLKRIFSGCILAVFVLMLAGCKGSDYKKANGLLENEEYSSAQEIFDTLGDYKDSKEMSAECQYQIAIQYYKDNNYIEAVSRLVEINDYSKATQAIHIIAFKLINDEYVDVLTKTTEYYSAYFKSESQKFIAWVYGGMSGDYNIDYSSSAFNKFADEKSTMKDTANKINAVFTAEVLEKCDDEVKNACEKFTTVNTYVDDMFTVENTFNLLTGGSTGELDSFDECASLASELEEALKALNAESSKIEL